MTPKSPAKAERSSSQHLIHVRDFEKMSRLPPHAVLWLLTNDLLECHSGDEGELFINIASLDFDALTRSLTESSALSALDDLLMERVRKVIAGRFATIVEDAFARPMAAPTSESNGQD